MAEKAGRVGRKRINSEAAMARYPAGTLARIEAVLRPGEKLADFLREITEAEIKRRGKKRDRPKPHN
jgi:hypothetical protein